MSKRHSNVIELLVLACRHTSGWLACLFSRMFSKATEREIYLYLLIVKHTMDFFPSSSVSLREGKKAGLLKEPASQ